MCLQMRMMKSRLFWEILQQNASRKRALKPQTSYTVPSFLSLLRRLRRLLPPLRPLQVLCHLLQVHFLLLLLSFFEHCLVLIRQQLILPPPEGTSRVSFLDMSESLSPKSTSITPATPSSLPAREPVQLSPKCSSVKLREKHPQVTCASSRSNAGRPADRYG
jgi:hypothetical protein